MSYYRMYLRELLIIFGPTYIFDIKNIIIDNHKQFHITIDVEGTNYTLEFNSVKEKQCFHTSLEDEINKCKLVCKIIEEVPVLIRPEGIVILPKYIHPSYIINYIV